MDDPARDRLYAMMDRLCELPRLDPPTVAEVLGRKAELVEQHQGVLFIYRLAPRGPDAALAGAELRWAPSTGKGFLRVVVAEGLRVAQKDVRARLGGPSKGSLIVPDPRQPPEERRYLYAYKVKVGELRLAFRALGSDSPLLAFSVDQNPIIAWDAAP